MTLNKYEFVSIGSGPAGHTAALQAAKLGHRTAIIDRRPRSGGVCLHTGTVPSKTLRESVMHLRGIRLRSFYGEEGKEKIKITLEDLLHRVEKVINQQSNVMDHQLKRNGVDIFYGQAAFAGSNRLEISTIENGITDEIEGEKILLACGSVPRRPPEIDFDQEVIFDSNFLFSSRNKRKIIPTSMIILGAGVIGTEYASIFGALGCKVTLIDKRTELFRFVDADICHLIAGDMKKNNVTILLGAKIEKITRTAKGSGQVLVKGQDPIEADCVLFTMGRTALTEPLRLQNVDVELTKYGTIVVNEHFQTNTSHIYAAGDVIGFPALASTSAAQGRMAALHALGREVHERPDLFPFAVYSIPEIAMVGKMESELKADNIPYAQGVAFYRENPKASMIGDETGAIKILFHPETLKILGVHILGDMASELIHIGSLSMSFEGTLDNFVDAVFNYPTLSSLYKNAALNGLNSLKGKSTYRNLLSD